MNPIKRNIPNAITCLNVLSGTAAIVFALNGDLSVGSLKSYELACICIGIAALADFCDGMSARLLHAYSDMGKELDSLCDLVSFGVAPAMLLFQSLRDVAAPGWLQWMALLIPVCGALRLAKFNTDTRQTTSFIGLPIPANAIFWIGFTSYCHRMPEVFSSLYVALPAILLISWLMVSEVGMFSLKFKSLGLKGNVRRWILLAAAVVFIVVMGLPGLMWLIIFYILLSMLSSKRKSR